MSDLNSLLADAKAHRDRLRADLEEVEAVVRWLERRENAPACRPPSALLPPPPPAAFVFVSPPEPPGSVVVTNREANPPGKPRARGTAGETAAVLARILAHGPLTPKQLGETLGESPGLLGYYLRRNPDLFEKVDPGNYKSPYRLTAAGRDAATAGGT